MPRYRVSGADKRTGKERTIEVSAVSEEAATRKANADGLLVSSAIEVGTGSGDAASSRPGVVDWLLNAAFGFVRALSAIVVVCCFAAIGVTAFLLCSTVLEGVPPSPADVSRSVETPTFKAWLAEQERARTSGAFSEARESAVDGADVTRPETTEDRIARIVANLPFSERDRFLRRVDLISLWPPDIQSRFADGVQAIVEEAPRNQVGAALMWYPARFEDEYEAAIDSADRARIAHAAMVAQYHERRLTSMTALLGSVAALVAFLFLPLAIQIERNTRMIRNVT